MRHYHGRLCDQFRSHASLGELTAGLAADKRFALHTEDGTQSTATGLLFLLTVSILVKQHALSSLLTG